MKVLNAFDASMRMVGIWHSVAPCVLDSIERPAARVRLHIRAANLKSFHPWQCIYRCRVRKRQSACEAFGEEADDVEKV